jgi:hypothetical protein
MTMDFSTFWEMHGSGPRTYRDWYNESEAVVGVGFRIVEAGILHQ